MNDKVLLDETGGNDIAKTILLGVLEKLQTRIKERGVEGISFSKRPCTGLNDCDAEHWALEVTIPATTKPETDAFQSLPQGSSKPS